VRRGWISRREGARRDLLGIARSHRVQTRGPPLRLRSHWIIALAAPVESAPAGPGPSWTRELDPTDIDRKRSIGFACFTDAGEGLLIYPKARLVVVRTISRTVNPYDCRYDARDHMEWLSQMDSPHRTSRPKSSAITAARRVPLIAAA
jgi:hypothetical protein